ncbi:hypothetical protein [Streptomyces sp. SP18CS02]|uniref:hypothetical protein n=1 Tax=Streptomyces sp. SP18CS02 TaxID=3002531 RepID=UPI002E764ABF|nr:hypothetical protein [Streptomyces sp. SP18CS02]MEE1753831.1 hypothetical protein [Streptomyces sp. SP18CS02]
MTERMTYVTHTGLRQRGWTDRMVRDLLGAPDVQGRSPRRWSVAPVRLYLLARVEAVERTEEFAASGGTSGAAAARAAAEARRQAVLAAIRAEPIRVPVLPEPELEMRAVRHRRLLGAGPGGGPGPGAGSAGSLTRWQVDYLRHALRRYDTLLDGLFGDTGRAEAERLLRTRVYAAIARAYPRLAGECRRRTGPGGRGG